MLSFFAGYHGYSFEIFLQMFEKNMADIVGLHVFFLLKGRILKVDADLFESGNGLKTDQDLD